MRNESQEWRKHIPDYWKNAKLACDDTSSRISEWDRVLSDLDIRTILEIGSFEGQSALYWLNKFPKAHLLCIDNWLNPTLGDDALVVEQHFNFNVEPFIITGRIIKWKENSTSALQELVLLGKQFDLIYIDGDHFRDQVIIDSVLAWPLAHSGSIVIWDDFIDYCRHLPQHERPEHAITTFCDWHKDEMEVLANTGQQLIVRRI